MYSFIHGGGAFQKITLMRGGGSYNFQITLPLFCELNIIVFSLENFLLFQILDITKNVTHDAPLQ